MIKSNIIRSSNGNAATRLLVIKPTNTGDIITEDGLLIPEGVGKQFEEGVITAVSEGSVFNVGDFVNYPLIDRENDPSYVSIPIDGETHDIIPEWAIWMVNDTPHEMLFVASVSDIEVSDTELIIPEKALGVPQKGIVVMAPVSSTFKKGDKVLYRKKEGAIYATATIDGVVVDVLPEDNIFMVNGRVAPDRALVKIDLVAQSKKRGISENGLLLDGKFVAMKYNLQYGEVVDIGDRASAVLPELRKGDLSIFTHQVEMEAYRLIRTEKNGNNEPIYEYRILNITAANTREVFGKLVQKKTYAKKKEYDIAPFNGLLFFDWDFAMFDKNVAWDTENASDSFDFNLSKKKDIHELKASISAKIKDVATEYDYKWKGLKEQIVKLDINNDQDKDMGDKIESHMLRVVNEYKAYETVLRTKVILKVRQRYPKTATPFKLVPHSTLYPIDILGKKYLMDSGDAPIAFYDSEFKTETIMDLTKLSANRDRVLVRPIETVHSETELLIPDTARKPSSSGIALSVGPGLNGIPMQTKVGDTVHYSAGSGRLIQLPGENLLILDDRDILVVISE